VYVTNGYMTPQALEKIGPYLDAANVDVKGFSKKFYNGVCKARLDPVLQTCERMHESGIHLELTYLIIPGLNDDEEQLGAFSAWAAGVDRDIPIHFSRFHPDWRMLDRPATPMETLKKAHHVATQAGLRYIYLGNIASEYENTFCPDCGAIIINRTGYRISKRGKTCPRCGYVAPIVD
jgi:pyruvate formate lyase activating enzyme